MPEQDMNIQIFQVFLKMKKVILWPIVTEIYFRALHYPGLFQSSELWKSYQPLVAVSTKKLEDRIQISITDNGSGIPDSIKDKIFQPFFTTKPTGQGTGLGLSMSFDIINKIHKGKLEVRSQEGEFTEFVITIPEIQN